MTVKSITLNK